MTIHKFKYENIMVEMNDAESSYYSGNFKRSCFYENEFLSYVSALSLSKTYLDIGTNIANHAVYFSMFTNADKVLGFEPIDAYRNIAIDNLRRNGLTNKAVIYGDALSDSGGSTTISIDGKPQTVALMELDKHEAAKNKISFIKMDVEGMEASVLRGAKATIQKNRPILFLEVIQDVGDEEYSLGDIKAIIDELDYQATGRAFNFQPTLEFVPKEQLKKHTKFAKEHPLPLENFKASNVNASIKPVEKNAIKLSPPKASASWFGINLSNFQKNETGGDLSLKDSKSAFLELEAYEQKGTKFYVIVNTYKNGEVISQTKKYINRRCFTPINGAKEADSLRVFIYAENGSVVLKKISFTTFQ